MIVRRARVTTNYTELGAGVRNARRFVRKGRPPSAAERANHSRPSTGRTRQFLIFHIITREPVLKYPRPPPTLSFSPFQESRTFAFYRTPHHLRAYTNAAVNAGRCTRARACACEGESESPSKEVCFTVLRQLFLFKT
jgi:hypothetical protein